MSKVNRHNQKVTWSDRAYLLLPFLVIGVVLWSGQANQAQLTSDLVAEQDFYCQMVDEGSWPDYKNTYKESCK